MAIAIDDTTVPRFTGTPANGVDITSASFTPANNSWIYVAVNGDSQSNQDITISVSGGSLTWSNEVERDLGDAGAQPGHSSIWKAQVVTGASMTISVRRTAGNGGTNRLSAKPYLVTGADATNPTGATGEGTSTTNNLSAAAYTSTVNNSRAIGCGCDWNQLGTPTSTDTEDGADYSGAISVVSAYKAADTPSSGTAVTLNFDAGGSSGAAWNWVALEIKPAAGGSTQTISPGGIASAEAFGTPQLNLSILAAAIASLEAFGAAVVQPGAVTVAPSGIASLEAFGNPTLATLFTIIANAIASAEAFGDPALALSYTIAPNGIASAEVFGDPVLSIGALIIEAAGIASAEAFGAHVLAPGAVLILPNGIPSAEIVGDALISAGSLVLSANGIGSAEAFGTPAFAPGGVNILPAGVASGEAFGAHALSATLTVIAQGIVSGEAFGQPTLNMLLLILMPAGIPSAEAFGAVLILGGGAPIALIIDDRVFAVSWIDERAITVSWEDDQTIDLG